MLLFNFFKGLYKAHDHKTTAHARIKFTPTDALKKATVGQEILYFWLLNNGDINTFVNELAYHVIKQPNFIHICGFSHNKRQTLGKIHLTHIYLYNKNHET
jgi:hypothetical protein